MINLTKEERHEASSGKLCPACKDKDILQTGSAPDGVHMNYQYLCRNKKCGCQWEGY